MSESTTSNESPGENSEESSVLGRASIFSHLQELSTRMKRSLYAYIIALVVVSSIPDPLHPLGGPNSFYGYNFFLTDLIRVTESRYAPGVTFIALGPSDPVFAFLNVSMVLALIVSLPYIFYEIYGFIAPGLYQREKRAVRKYVLPFSILLTVGGVFGLVVIFPIVMKVLLLFFLPIGVGKFMTIDNFVTFMILIPLITGLAFTFPVFLIPLVEMRVLSAKQLSRSRKWVYVLVALGVSIANPDPTDISSIPIVVPILVLFEVTVLIAKRIEKNRAAKIAAEQELATPPK